MNQSRFLNIVLIVIIFILLGVIGYLSFFKPSWVTYTDQEYGFKLEIPQSSSLSITSGGTRDLGVVRVSIWDSKGLSFQDFIVSQWGISEDDFGKRFTSFTNSKGYEYFKESVTERSRYVQGKSYFFPREGSGNYIIVLYFTHAKLSVIGDKTVQRIINSVDLNVANKLEITIGAAEPCFVELISKPAPCHFEGVHQPADD